MVEDLHDSERKLSKLLEQYENHGILCEVTKLLVLFTNCLKAVHNFLCMLH